MSDTGPVPFSASKYGINTMNRITKYISIHGVIGAGKSTFIDRLKFSIKMSGQCAKTCTDFTLGDYYLIVDEPVDEWLRVKCSTRTFKEEPEPIEDQKSLLDTFYADKKKYAFLFQVYAFNSRLRRIIEEMNSIHPLIPADARVHIISERSMRSDCLFFRNLYESDVGIPGIEWFVYENFFNIICAEIIKKEDMMIYIDTDPHKCFGRLKKRDRQAETSHCTSEKEDTEFLAYLESLDVHHKRMINEFKEEKGENSVYVVDGNVDITREEDYDAIVAHFRNTAVA